MSPGRRAAARAGQLTAAVPILSRLAEVAPTSRVHETGPARTPAARAAAALPDRCGATRPAPSPCARASARDRAMPRARRPRRGVRPARSSTAEWAVGTGVPDVRRAERAREHLQQRAVVLAQVDRQPGRASDRSAERSLGAQQPVQIGRAVPRSLRGATSARPAVAEARGSRRARCAGRRSEDMPVRAPERHQSRRRRARSRTRGACDREARIGQQLRQGRGSPACVRDAPFDLRLRCRRERRRARSQSDAGAFAEPGDETRRRRRGPQRHQTAERLSAVRLGDAEVDSPATNPAMKYPSASLRSVFTCKSSLTSGRIWFSTTHNDTLEGIDKVSADESYSCSPIRSPAGSVR